MNTYFDAWYSAVYFLVKMEKCAKNIFVKCKVQTVETKLLTFNQFLDSVTSQTAWPKVARQDVG
jgi:hypothetical protein